MLVLFYVLICLIFGTTFLGIKLGVEAGGPPFLFAGIRFFCAGVMVLGYLWWRKYPFPRQVSTYGRLLLVGCLTTTVLFGVLYWSEQFIPSNLAALINAISPVMVSLLGLMKKGQRLHVTTGVGLLLGMFGVYLIVGGPAAGVQPAYWWSAIIVLLTAHVFNAWGVLESRRLLLEGVSSWVVSGFQMVFGSLGLFVASLVHHESFASVKDPLGAFGSLAFLIVIGSIVGWGLYYFLIARTNPLLPTTWCYVSPVVAMIVGYLWLQEKVTLTTVIGGLTVLVGVGLSNWTDWKLLLSRKERAISG
jgi:drug/metabolite transporter (DMT)-like permease